MDGWTYKPEIQKNNNNKDGDRALSEKRNKIIKEMRLDGVT